MKQTISCYKCNGTDIYFPDLCSVCKGAGTIEYVSLGKNKMPPQKPGKSEQTVGTPRRLVEAIEKKFGGSMDWDLAAVEENKKAPKFFSPQQDSLKQEWKDLKGFLWLNPPYADIESWVKKAYETTGSLGPSETPKQVIFVLIPAAVGTNYFKDWIFDKARVYFLSPRLTFEGHKNSYPKDLILCVYGLPQRASNFECWRWDKE